MRAISLIPTLALALSTSCSAFVVRPTLLKPAQTPALVRTESKMKALALPPLPTCSVANVWRLAGWSGGTALVAQLGLSAMFARSSNVEYNRTPGQTAHKVVSLIVMVMVSVVGGLALFTPGSWPTSAAAALIVPDATCRFIAALLLGELLLWDLPTFLWIPKLRKRKDLLYHHVGLAFAVWVTAALAPAYYGLYYFGLSEGSAVPLTLNGYFAAAHDAVQEEAPVDEKRLARLAKLRDSFQILAALCFVVFRSIGFTWFTFCKLLPQTVELLRPPISAAALALATPLKLHCVIAVSFNLLQFYWLLLLVKYTIATGLGGEIPEND